jgi:hypothetical protein
MLYNCATEEQFTALATFLTTLWISIGEASWCRSMRPFLFGEHHHWCDFLPFWQAPMYPFFNQFAIVSLCTPHHLDKEKNAPLPTPYLCICVACCAHIPLRTIYQVINFQVLCIHMLCRYHAVTGIPGLLPCTQPLERWQEEQHRDLPSKPSHVAALKDHYPKSMKADAANHFGPITRQLPHIPSVLANEAKEYLIDGGSNQEGSGNFLPVRAEVDYTFVYVNRDPMSRGSPPVTEKRCEVHKQCLNHGVQPRNVRTLLAWEKACLSLVEVCLSHDVDMESNHETEGHSCDCQDFYIMRTCPHLLAALHVFEERDGVDIIKDTMPAFPSNKPKGRSSRKKRALQP